MCLLDALSRLCEVNDIKVLKGSEHDVCLRLLEEEIKMVDLTTQQTWVLDEIRPLVRDADKLMAQIEALKERFKKVMNHLKTRKRFVDHVGNSIHRTIYMVDRCKGELMSQKIGQCNEISRDAIYNLKAVQSDVDAANNAL